VCDAYLHGVGQLSGKALGIVPVVSLRGTPQLASGELARYLVEAAWFPTALLPGAGVSWAPIDTQRARATVADGATTVSNDFTFDAEGRITRVSTMRERTIEGGSVLTRWSGTLGDYRRVNGMMIPTSGEVAWEMPEGSFPYWRGRITAIDCEFA
jgi:hypothetical protein